MPRDGTSTKTAIMDAAERLILDRGFAATSVDAIIEAAGITKGTFFYHFKSKAELALSLVQRFAEADRAHLEDKMARAETLSRDPLQQVLIFIGLFIEDLVQLTQPYPGCLFASFCYEAQLFDTETLKVIDEAMWEWRRDLGGKFEKIIERYPPRLEVEARSLADMATVAFEGAFIVSKTLKEPQVVAEQLTHYRNYVELLFAPAES